MNPWLMFWAPQVTMPLGGSVAQRIDPNNSWFFDGISDTAGDKTLERKAFEVASYGRQLGLITEVLIDLAARLPPTSAEAAKSLVRLRDIQNRIEQLKDADTLEIAQQIDGLLVRLEKKNPERVAAACKRVERALTAPVDGTGAVIGDQ